MGAGVIGCALAHGLTRAGASVTVVERSSVAAEASGAVAGILAPRVFSTDKRMFPLAMVSAAQFEPLLEDVRSATSLDVQYVRSGVLDLAFTELEVETLQDKARLLRNDGHDDVRWLAPEDVRQIEPQTAGQILGAFYDPDAHHIHPERFTWALAQASANRGARFDLGTEVLGLTGAEGRATGVRTAAGNMSAGHVVLASGSWAAAAEGWIGSSVPVFPAKGQILTVLALPSPIRSVISGAGAYLVPRVDGTIVVGATVEHVGHDKHLTADALAWLLESIPTLCPALQHARFDRAWAGLRPETPDELPIMGPAPGWENVTLAAGHFRSGIMLAPITASLLVPQILEGKSDPLLRPLDPARFLGRPKLQQPNVQ